MAANKVLMEVTKARIVPLCREGDRYLMDDIRILECFDDKDLYDLNACQMHLQVTTLSDICNRSGQMITEEAWMGKCLTDRESNLRWPRQPVVTKCQRNLWQKALAAVYTSSGRTLKEPLGKWTETPNQVWRSFLDVVSGKIIISTKTDKDAEYFIEYAILSPTRHHVEATQTQSASPHSSLLEINWDKAVLATVAGSDDNTTIKVTYHSIAQQMAESKEKPMTFAEYCMIALKRQGGH